MTCGVAVYLRGSCQTPSLSCTHQSEGAGSLEDCLLVRVYFLCTVLCSEGCACVCVCVLFCVCVCVCVCEPPYPQV